MKYDEKKLMQYIIEQVLNLVCELPEEDTDVPKYVAVVQNHTDMSVVWTFVCFYKWIFLKLLLLE